jgi:hypothetical protein
MDFITYSGRKYNRVHKCKTQTRSSQYYDVIIAGYPTSDILIHFKLRTAKGGHCYTQSEDNNLVMYYDNMRKLNDLHYMLI